MRNMKMKINIMKPLMIITAFLAFSALFPARGQETVIKREITLYNPYKPSLPDVVKKSFLPDMTDTSAVKPVIKYEIRTTPYTPPYTVSPLKAATMVPDPLTKLYNGYINMGLGNYLTPLAEISITNLRSKQSGVGIYAGHFSTNGKVKLENGKKEFAGYMDNNVSLYGRKFLDESVLKGSIDFSRKTRYAYGYNPGITDYDPEKKDFRLNYTSAGINAGISSVRPDSSKLVYEANLDYNFFISEKNMYLHKVKLTGQAGKEVEGFYAGSGAGFEFYKPSGYISSSSAYIAEITPFITRKSADWNAKLGAGFVLDKFIDDDDPKLHIYPDLRFGFNIMPSYLAFYAELKGKLERNTPENVIMLNPFVLSDYLYKIRNTCYPLIVSAGLEGESGIEGRYRLNVSYTIADDFLLFTNYAGTRNDTINILMGNYFKPLFDEAEILKFHGETAGRINRHFTFSAEGNYYKYTLTSNKYAWGMPDWDLKFNLKYNLRDKIIASIGVNTTGPRKLLTTTDNFDNLFNLLGSSEKEYSMPAHLNFNFSAEYRYTKILSFWLKFNNLSFTKYYEWAWYPSLRFICMAGFTYSL